MPSYVVETFLAGGQTDERGERGRRAHAAAAELTRGGASFRFDRAIHIPEDEICFFVFYAPSRREAKQVALRAGLQPLRVVEAVGFGGAGL